MVRLPTAVFKRSSSNQTATISTVEPYPNTSRESRSSSITHFSKVSISSMSSKESRTSISSGSHHSSKRSPHWPRMEELPALSSSPTIRRH
ncbi:hypothetical protein GcM1_211012 [Golovinomyces cichoracearum]|uniref:Uncharacterized protein n=1 Tax=Golovinomyces cichoracearum TaxID=62708 RepID=A0A420IV23_9PEZI|nr:hypothetical protein GcM1_211012 [Golovinomyces cichoracearum]